MGLHVFWPATACLTLFVVCVIILMLKYGGRVCKLRHEPLRSDQEWEGKAYTRKLSVSVE
ncbi:PREDICTED: uncharacterized protein LOC106751556 [Dinoponera quadriceps]|uniref:Uncharacterized protein LOC106751556 n=1 Tax=Dinoponera quadriceps TaxID=609295 RepID=A0A6P3YDG0_DINQU|nr:PREDICTED: uncharacterized protein LOC106751556 [Dinoponera quadriceps]